MATSSSFTLDSERTDNATLRAGVPSGEVVEVSGGFREAFEGEIVDFDWQPVYPGSQDGYDSIATSVWPRGG